jgi:hypothetical protein
MIMRAQAESVSTFLKPSRRGAHGVLGGILLLVCLLGSTAVLVRVHSGEPSVFEQIA